MKRVLLALALLLSAGARAESPDWAKPYLKQAAPSGGYIAKDDRLVALMSEVEVSFAPGGGLARTYRTVIAPLNASEATVEIEIGYDEVTQSLSPPQMWIPGAFGYKALDMKKHSIDIPNLSEMVSSERELYIASRPLVQGEKALVTWTVVDRSSFPGQDVFRPPWGYPTAKWSVRSVPRSDGRRPVLHIVMPGDASPSPATEGEVTLESLPALRRVVNNSDPWGASAWETLPYVVASVESPDWSKLAERAEGLFLESMKKDGARAYAQKAAELADGAGDLRVKIARVAQFVQGLSYRDIAWGKGAYEPEPPSETLRTMTADCKAKVLLMRAMLSELGVRSVPVLCHSSEAYFSRTPVPCLLGFNHVVLAVDKAALGVTPASLLEGPGEGWLLFDPTDPMSVLGLPPEEVEGTPGLWCEKGAGQLFTIRTSRPGSSEAKIEMTVEVGSSGLTRCEILIEGWSQFLSNAVANRFVSEDPQRFRTRCEEYFRGVAPGLVVEAAKYTPPDHVKCTAPKLELRCAVKSALQPAGGELQILPFPMEVLRLAFGFPSIGFTRKDTTRDGAKITRPGWVSSSNYQGNNQTIQGKLLIRLGEGMTVEAWPGLQTAIRTPWIDADSRSEEGLEFSATIHRGKYEAGQESARLKDLNALCGLFRRPVLLRGKPAA